MKSVLLKYNIFYTGISVLLIINVICIVFIFQNQSCKKHQDMVAFLNIGQGDAIYIQNKEGQNMLIDTGNKDSGVLKQVQKVTSCNKVKIQNLLLTHPDQDHIGEATRLISKGLVQKVIHNGFIDMDQAGESQTENSLEEIIKNRNIQTQDIVANPILDLKDFGMQVLYPVEKPYQDAKGKGKSVDDNDYSIVLKVSYKDETFLLTGDAPMKAEDEMIGRYCISATTTCPVLQSDVLKLGHHGSKNSSDTDFLQRVDAADYIVSAGLNNKFNHPNEEMLARIQALNKKDSRVRETFVEGNIVYLFD